MTCYLLPIGGSGIRVMRALIHLCGAGCFPHVDFRVMCIDSDGVNGDKNRLMETLTAYRALQRSNPNLTRIEPCGANGVWSPLDVVTQSMSKLVNAELMSGDASDVFEFLFTPPERETILEGGVYGRTSIGSYFISQQILDERGQYSQDWQNFFGAPDAGRDKIFIIGSMFGGTGASGIPTIARILKAMPLTADLPIGAAFVMPYFRPSVEPDKASAKTLSIDWRTFSAKAKTALSFYIDQNLDDIFQAMYFIGEQEDNFMWVKNHSGGAKQLNKANVIEAHAAAFVKDFLAVPGDGAFRVRFYGMGNAPDMGIAPDLLNNVTPDADVFDKLMDFFFLAAFHTKYAHPSIMAGESKCVMGWLRRLNRECLLSEEDSAALNAYAVLYLRWMRESLILTDSRGEIQWDMNNPRISWLKTSGDFAALFDGEELYCQTKGFRKMRHYEWEDLEIFPEAVKDENAGRPTGEAIAVELSGTRFSPGGNQSNLEFWMDTVLSLCRKRDQKGA